jgi:ABC-2 type transport system permease protein
MFSTIFLHELRYWLKRPSFYIYLTIFFIASIGIASGIAGFFNNLDATSSLPKLVNSPIGIYNIYNTLTVLIFFLLPSIIGVTIYRDFKSGMHELLYSYPFTKANYLFAKFFSGVTIVTSIVFIIGIGIVIGFNLPGIDPDLVGAFNFMTYLKTYLVYLLPNILLYGAIVFAVVSYTRNITAGFIAFIVLLILQIIMATLLTNPNYESFAALLNPTGASAVDYYTKYWTVAEQNNLDLPFKGFIIYNRLLWLMVTTLVFGISYRFFSFSQQPVPFSFRRKLKGMRSTKSNFGSLTKVELSEVNLNFSFLHNLRTTWKLSNIDFKYITKSIPFIAILTVGVVLLILDYIGSGSFRGTFRYPVTWKMLEYSEGYTLAIMICTFLYAGMLNQRSKIVNINLLVDATPVPNWTLLVSKLLALLKMQLVFLFALMIVGISYQTYKGYTHFELLHYVFDLFVLNFSYFMLWAFLALFVQTLVRNPFIGLFLLIISFLILSTPLTSIIGIEQTIFKYASGSWYRYSDMNGYGDYLSRYFIYRVYWLLAGMLLLIITGLFLVRGLPHSFRQRVSIAKFRFKRKTRIGFGLLLIGFLSMGSRIYYENNTLNTTGSEIEQFEHNVQWEKRYQKYQAYKQPRIVSVNVNFNIFPKTLNFDLVGTYTLVNKSEVAIDSVFLKYKDYPSTFKFNRPHTLVSKDTEHRFDIYQLKESLQPGDSLELRFTIKNKPNTMLHGNPLVLGNGTYISKSKLLPTIGYHHSSIKDSTIRRQKELTPIDIMRHPSDTTALVNNMISNDADWIDFEAILSTSKDQIAIAPGYLQNEWLEGERRYFHYKMDSKILNIYSFNSGRYEIKKDTWNGVNLEIYYHKDHAYNLDRMMAGMKASLAYNSTNFGPYQYKQVRIIEYPATIAGGASAFANTIPFSESHGFIADVVDTEEGGIDYPFAVTVHEVAHQWWAHQVMGAYVLGARVLTESISDYVRLKTLEQRYGKSEMRQFLKYALDHYLSERGDEISGESPLMYNTGQHYINYSKGAIVFYALSDYIGEENLNKALRNFLEQHQFKGPPYATSIDLLEHIKKVTPDELKYIIKDMFETITLYENKMVAVKSTKLENGKYQVDLEFMVSKYRVDQKGNKIYSDVSNGNIEAGVGKTELSLPLADYIDIGIFSKTEVSGKKKEKEVYLRKHKITSIHNKIIIIVDQKPTEVGVDPYVKLIDVDSVDNRMSVED